MNYLTNYGINMPKNKLFILLLLVSLHFSHISCDTDDYRGNEISVESDASNDSLWRPVLKKTSNTVVQIFAMLAKFDWLEPYKTPMQGQGRGSGFFINEDGYIITNAHVVDQSIAIFIGIPQLGKRHLRAEIVSTCPERDIALLKLDEKSLALVKQQFGSVPYVEFGNSDNVEKSDEVLALGYPLGLEYLKSTVGVISGSHDCKIQIDAAINPGNSGGPLFNKNGLVIGINSSGFNNAQNSNFAIPINVVKTILPDLYHNPLLKKPFLGVICSHANDQLAEYLGNPLPGGCFISGVWDTSPLAQVGLKPGDMLYAVNGYTVDIYGEICTPNGQEKIKWTDYTSQLALGSEISIVVYRNGTQIDFTIPLEISDGGAVEQKYPWHETIDYEVFAGMVIMQLTTNHIALLASKVPNLKRYVTPLCQNGPRLIITNIFPDCQLAQINSIYPGDTLNEINGETVETLDDFRKAIGKSLDNGYVIIKATDETTLITDNILAVLPLEECCKETVQLSRLYRYPLSETIMQLIEDTAQLLQLKRI